MVLLQEGESLARSDHNISIGRFELPGKDFKESRFTGTVCSDQTVAVAFGKFDVDILKEGFFAEIIRYLFSSLWFRIKFSIIEQ